MKNLTFAYFPSSDIIEHFGEKAVDDHFNGLFGMMTEFLAQNGLSDRVTINRMLLSNAVIDYFNDIKRIMDFHGNIEKVNSEKVIAYTSYWLLQRAPLQASDREIVKEPDKKLATINELFVLQYIGNYLSVRECGDHLFLRENIGLQNFSKYLLYYLIYRLHSPHSLEMMLCAFMAGQIYERTDRDISEELHPYDVE